jgi:hypothetical protein
VFSQDSPWKTLAVDRETSIIRHTAHACAKGGGLVVLCGNIAEEGCIVKTSGVNTSILTFAGPAGVFASQKAAVAGIHGSQVAPGDVVVVLWEGPKGGPGMREMLDPTSSLKSTEPGKVSALVTDGRFSGSRPRLSIGHVTPQAAEGGTIGPVEDRDRIELDIAARSIRLAGDEGEFARRRAAMEARGEATWQARNRSRTVSAAVQAAAALTMSAVRGAVRAGSASGDRSGIARDTRRAERQITRRMLLAGALWAGAAVPASAQQICQASPSPARTTTQCLLYPDFTPPRGDRECRGCGCRGGPGCRKADGRCAAWRDRVVPDCRAIR